MAVQNLCQHNYGAIDSPFGFAEKAALWVKDAFSDLGFDARITNKGGVLVDISEKHY